jgi:iron(III) transport system substrate-binding protein
MKKFIWLIAFFILLALPISMRAWEGPSAATSDQSAPRLVVITPNSQDIRNEIRWAFADWHEKHYGVPVELEYLTPGGTSDVRRQLDTIYRAIRSAHGGSLPPEEQLDVPIQIVWGGGDFFFDRQLKPLGILRPIDLTPAQLKEIFPEPLLDGSKLYDRQLDAKGNLLPPLWVGYCLSSFGIVYNSELCAALGAPDPQTWSDLTNPRYVGSVALADPTHSATAAQMYMIILLRAMADAEQKFLALPANQGGTAAELESSPEYQAALDEGFAAGKRELTLIAANARYFTYDSSRVPTDVGLGDSAVGTAIDYYGRSTEETVGSDRVKFVSPKSATSCNCDPVAILYGTHGQSLEYADHFIEFLLSPEGQRFWELKPGEPGGPRLHALRRSPIRLDVYSDTTGWADTINFFSQSRLFQLRPQWMTMLQPLGPIWAAAWVDDGEDLRAAYRKILAVPDPARRAKLIYELADLPLTREQVLHSQTNSNSSTDPDLSKAEERLSWAKKFRDHYLAVAAEAGQESE